MQRARDDSSDDGTSIRALCVQHAHVLCTLVRSYNRCLEIHITPRRHCRTEKRAPNAHVRSILVSVFWILIVLYWDITRENYSNAGDVKRLPRDRYQSFRILISNGLTEFFITSAFRRLADFNLSQFLQFEKNDSFYFYAFLNNIYMLSYGMMMILKDCNCTFHAIKDIQTWRLKIVFISKYNSWYKIIFFHVLKFVLYMLYIMLIDIQHIYLQTGYDL